jgi:hypothetical protein
MTVSTIKKVCVKCGGEAHTVTSTGGKEITKCMACGLETGAEVKKPLTQQPTPIPAKTPVVAAPAIKSTPVAEVKKDASKT